MDNLKGKRGRKAGDTKIISIIKDDCIHPYEIIVEERSFNVMDSRKSSNNGFMGSYTTLPPALKKITMYVLANKSKTYTIKEYIKELRELQDKIIETINE